MRTITNEINEVLTCDTNQLVALSKKFRAPLNVLDEIKELGKLPVVNFADWWNCYSSRRRFNDATRM